ASVFSVCSCLNLFFHRFAPGKIMRIMPAIGRIPAQHTRGFYFKQKATEATENQKITPPLPPLPSVQLKLRASANHVFITHASSLLSVHASVFSVCSCLNLFFIGSLRAKSCGSCR